MPKLNDNNNYKCFLCGGQARFISFNTKRYRCTEIISKCPGHAKKAELSRSLKITKEDRRRHMKMMSINGNKRLKELSENNVWLMTKNKNISKSRTTICEENRSLWEDYEYIVDKLTAYSWKFYVGEINTSGLKRGRDYELDHKYSKHQGFLNKIPPKTIAHPNNLELLTISENRKKSNKCSISLMELKNFKDYGNFAEGLFDHRISKENLQIILSWKL